MSIPAPDEISIEDPLCNSSLGSMVTLDYVTLLTPERNQDLRCQFGPSAKDSVIFSGGDYSKNFWADRQRLQISDLHFDKFPVPATFACWKIRFKTEVCTCSQFPTEAMQWIKEVELVDSVDEEKKKKKAQKEDRFLRGRQIAYLIYDQFWVTGTHDSVENYTDLITIVLRNCVGCDIVQADHAPDGGVAQGIFHGILVRHHGRNQEEVEEGLEKEVERDKEEDTQTTTCTCMDAMM